MCCWPVATVELEDAPPKPKHTYVLVSDKLNLQPMVSEPEVLSPFPYNARKAPLRPVLNTRTGGHAYLCLPALPCPNYESIFI